MPPKKFVSYHIDTCQDGNPHRFINEIMQYVWVSFVVSDLLKFVWAFIKTHKNTEALSSDSPPDTLRLSFLFVHPPEVNIY